MLNVCMWPCTALHISLLKCTAAVQCFVLFLNLAPHFSEFFCSTLHCIIYPLTHVSVQYTINKLYINAGSEQLGVSSCFLHNSYSCVAHLMSVWDITEWQLWIRLILGTFISTRDAQPTSFVYFFIVLDSATLHCATLCIWLSGLLSGCYLSSYWEPNFLPSLTD